MAKGIVLNIDTTKSEFQNPMVQLRQGDGNYQSLSVTVTSNGEPFDLTGWTITFMGTTAGGFKIVDTASVVTNALQGQFTYTPTKAWGQDEGEFKNAYFKFVKSDETASGASFRVNVLDAVDLTAEEAGDYISIVDQTIATLNGDLTTLQSSVDQLKAQNNAIKTSDNTWTGTNTFNKKIIAPAGFQGNADTTTKLQTARNINGNAFDGTADINVNAANDGNLVHKTGDETVGGFKKFSGNIATTSDNSMINGGGNEGDIAFVKKSGDTSFLAIGNKKSSLKIKLGSNAVISPLDTFTDIFSVDINGVIKAGTQQYLVPLNNNVVHNTDTETVAGDKTFTGNVIATQPINGILKLNAATVTDLNNLTTSGSYTINNSIINTPASMPNGAVINISTFDANVTYQVITARDETSSLSGKVKTWVRGKFGSTWAGWRMYSLDDTVVHNTGNENIAGDKTFTGNNNFSGATTIKTGNYGLRVTNTGVQKTSDGGTTWVNI